MSKIKYWILDDEGIPKEASLTEWAKFFESGARKIAHYERDGYWISTIFLGIDHNFFGEGPPILFESMMFDDTREEREAFGRKYTTIGEAMEQRRYSTKDDALIGHERLVNELDRKLDYAEGVAKNLFK